MYRNPKPNQKHMIAPRNTFFDTAATHLLVSLNTATAILKQNHDLDCIYAVARDISSYDHAKVVQHLESLAGALITVREKEIRGALRDSAALPTETLRSVLGVAGSWILSAEKRAQS